jgi:cytochrome c-type biogenesis protein
MLGTFGLAFLAGVLSILSPCVLPLVPLVLGAAVSEHRLAPVALAGGVAVSFTAIGLFVATIGFAIGLDGAAFRTAAAIVMVGIGGVLLVPAFQLRLTTAASPFGSWAEERFGGFSSAGIPGQFGVGLLLGAVWSPCVGPTLGAASVLAAQGRDLLQVAASMLVFGVGAALPLLVFGLLSRETLMRWRKTLGNAAGWLKVGLGAVLVTLGALTFAGWDKAVEAALVEASPDWLTALTTRF